MGFLTADILENSHGRRDPQGAAQHAAGLEYTRCYAGLPRFYRVDGRLGDGGDDQPHTATEYNKSRKHVEVLIPHGDPGEDDHSDGNEYHADHGGPAQSKA